MRVGLGVVCVVVLALGGAGLAAPTVQPGSKVQATVVRREGAIDRWLARWLLPRAWTEPRATLHVDNMPAGTLIASASATGVQSGAPLPPAAIGVGELHVGPNKHVAVPITIARASLDPDRYTGVLRVGTETETIAEVPLDITVRSGPFGALLWLFAGVLIGLGLKKWNESGQRMARALDELDRWSAIIATESRVNRGVLEALVGEAVEAKYRGEVELVEAQIASIETRRPMLHALDRLWDALPNERASIENIRSMIRRGRDKQAKDEIEALERKADTATGGQESFSLGSDEARVEVDKPAVPFAPSGLQVIRLWLLQFVAGRAVRVLAIIGAVLLGFKTLYVDGGATYGANGIFDGLALFAWGLGAEVTTRIFARFAKPQTAKASKGSDDAGDDETTPTASKGSKAAGDAGDERLTLPEDVSIVDDEGGPESFSPSAWPANALDLEELDTRGLHGDGVTIAVIDTGVALSQPKLDKSRITSLALGGSTGGNDHHGHGTSMIALLASDRAVCSKPKVISIAALDSQGTARAKDLAKGIDLAIAHKCDVISISVGQAAKDNALSAAVKRARDNGIVVVAAIRKENPNSSAYPARDEGVSSVTPSRENGHLVYKPPPGWISIAAPGVAIPTYSRSSTATISGASAATVIVAGVCARLLGAVAADKRADLGRRLDGILRSTAKKVDGGRLIRALEAANNLKDES